MGDIDDEIWKPILQGNRQYEVSSHGRVRRSPARPLHPGRVLATWPHRDGYHLVRLMQGRRQREYLVHTLVARAFLGYRPTGKVIEFNDGDRSNARASNLQYVTRRQSHARSSRLGLITREGGRFQKSGRVPENRVTAEKVREMRRLFDAGLATYDELAQQFNIDPLTVENIVHRKTWVKRSGVMLEAAPTDALSA